MSVSSRWAFSRLVAHRGGGKLAPENTLAAIGFGHSLGYRAIEFDVMLTKDRCAILMHDEQVGRTVQLPDGRKDVLISDLNLEDIVNLDAGSWLNERFSHARVPLFEDVLRFCVDNDIWMNIEIKPCPGFEKETGTVVAGITAKFFEDNFRESSEGQSASAQSWPLFSSFSFDSLMSAKEAAPHIKRGLLIDDLASTPQWREQCRQIGAYSLHVDHKDISPTLIEEVQSLGLGLFCYTVNDVTRGKELWSMGVDSFCTDALLDFQQFL